MLLKNSVTRCFSLRNCGAHCKHTTGQHTSATQKKENIIFCSHLTTICACTNSQQNSFQKYVYILTECRSYMLLCISCVLKFINLLIFSSSSVTLISTTKLSLSQPLVNLFITRNAENSSSLPQNC